MFKKIFGLSFLLLGMLVLGCSGSSTLTTPVDQSSVPNTPTATHTIVAPTEQPPEPMMIPNESPTPTDVPDVVQSDPTEIIDRGKALFESEAGGVGCALCHGMDGKGKPELATPSNRGATADAIWEALENRPQMSFLVLTDEEVTAISAYLKILDTQP